MDVGGSSPSGPTTPFRESTRSGAPSRSWARPDPGRPRFRPVGRTVADSRTVTSNTRTCRAALTSDIESLALVELRSWTAAFQDVLDPADIAALRLETLRERWVDRLGERDGDRANTLCLVEEDEGDTNEILGYFRWYPSEDVDLDPAQVAEVGALYTVPSSWRSGAGTSLLRAALDAATAAGYLHAVLWVLEDNTRARAFYERQRWEHDGVHDTVRSGPRLVRRLRYRRRLAA